MANRAKSLHADPAQEENSHLQAALYDLHSFPKD